MRIFTYIKRGLQYIVSGIPVTKVYPQIVKLTPGQLLDGRVALITGGTSGIGLEIAKAFVDAGATVIITGRDREKTQSACDKISEQTLYKKNIFGMDWDIIAIDSFKDKFEELSSMVQKPIDILVNNAGVHGGSLNDCTLEEYDNILNTNLRGVFFMSQIFGKYMKENHIAGNILNIASSSSLRPAASAYTLTKWGIRGLTEGLAKSLAPYGITVNGIAPGATATPMLMKKGITENIELPSNPIGRFALPEEIANMAVVLVSNMGKTIVGDIVYMTGGAGIITFDDVKYKF